MRATTAIHVAGLEGGLVELAAEQLSGLQSRVQGPLLLPDDTG